MNTHTVVVTAHIVAPKQHNKAKTKRKKKVPQI